MVGRRFMEDTKMVSTKMTMDSLVNEEQLRTSEQLHRSLAEARGALEQARARRDDTQLVCEENRTALIAAERSGALQERLRELEAACKKVEGERDAAWKPAVEAVRMAEAEVRRFDGRFHSAASSWLDNIRQRYDFDTALNDFILAERR